MAGVRTRRSRWAGEAAGLLRSVRWRLEGRDLALIAAGLTFYAGIAVVPLLVVAFALTARLSSPDTVRELGERLTELLPDQLGAPAAVARLISAGISLGSGAGCSPCCRCRSTARACGGRCCGSAAGGNR